MEKTTMQNEKENHPLQQSERIEKLTGRILKLLCVYTVGITLLRLSGFGRLAHGVVESIVYRVYTPTSVGGILFGLLPIVITLYACKTRLNERSRLLVLCFAGCALFNHAGLLLMIAGSFIWVYMAAPGFLMIAPFVLLVLLVYIFVLFKSCLTLGRLKKENGEDTGDSSSIMLTVFCMGFLFLLSPALTWTPSALWNKASFSLGMRKDIQLITSDDCTLLTSTPLSVRVSPDGKLIAMGGVQDLSVWDAESRKLLLNDTTISCRSVRFSDSGKYLAAVGTATSRDQSCVVLYEVDGFKKLPQVSLSPDMRVGRKTVVLDVAFRPDEKSMIYAYYSYWNEKQFLYKDWVEFQKKENIKLEYPLKFDPTCHEVEIPSGKMRMTKQLTNLSLLVDAIESIQFSPDASTMAYVHGYYDKNFGPMNKHFSFYNTSTWQEKVVHQDDLKYQIRTWKIPLDKQLPEYTLDSWSQGKVYFLYQSIEYINPYTSTPLKRSGEYVLAELDIVDSRSQDIASGDQSGASLSGGMIVSVSPSGMRVLFSGEGGSKEGFDSYLLIVDLTEGKKLVVRKMKFDPKLNSRWIYRAAWLDENRVVLTTERRALPSKNTGEKERLMVPRFFYVDVTD